MIALALLLAVAPDMPQASGDWLAWCEPAHCTAELLPTARAAPLALSLQQVEGGVALAMPLPKRLKRGQRARLSIDGKVIADVESPGGGGVMALPVAGTLGTALRSGRRLTLADPAGKTIATASLSGFTAALAFVEKRQPPGTAPALHLPGASARAPRAPSAKALRQLPAGCPGVAPRLARLDAARTLALFAGGCGSGAPLRLTVDEKGRPTPLALDVGALASVRWDDAERRLVLSDPTGARCVGEQRLAWTGDRFALAERRYACRGRAAPIVTYSAPVTTR